MTATRTSRRRRYRPPTKRWARLCYRKSCRLAYFLQRPLKLRLELPSTRSSHTLVRSLCHPIFPLLENSSRLSSRQLKPFGVLLWLPALTSARIADGKSPLFFELQLHQSLHASNVGYLEPVAKWMVFVLTLALLVPLLKSPFRVLGAADLDVPKLAFVPEDIYEADLLVLKCEWLAGLFEQGLLYGNISQPC